MLFYKGNGQYLEINRKNYVSETDYYTAIIATKGITLENVIRDPDKRIFDILQVNKVDATKIVAPARIKENR